MVVLGIKSVYQCEVPRIVPGTWKVLKDVSFTVCYQGRQVLKNIRLSKYKVGRYERKTIFLNITDTSLIYLLAQIN